MKLLLDTHAFLSALNLIVDPSHNVLLSAASYWEIAIKISIGKYKISGEFEEWIEEQIQVNTLEILPIEIGSMSTL